MLAGAVRAAAFLPGGTRKSQLLQVLDILAPSKGGAALIRISKDGRGPQQYSRHRQHTVALLRGRRGDIVKPLFVELFRRKPKRPKNNMKVWERKEGSSSMQHEAGRLFNTAQESKY